MSKGLDEANETINKIASILLEETKAVIRDKAWAFVFIDVRGTKTKVSKLRAGWLDGSTCPLLDTSLENTPPAIDDLVDSIWKIKDQVFEKKWYGLKVTVFPEGKSKVDF